jgi:hypothetical protein
MKYAKVQEFVNYERTVKYMLLPLKLSGVLIATLVTKWNTYSYPCNKVDYLLLPL